MTTPSALLLAALAASACTLPDAHTICVYTARAPDQIARELPEFAAAHPEVRLACPTDEREPLYCPSRLADPDDLMRCAEDEPWIVLREAPADLTRRLTAEHARPVADVIWGLGLSRLLALRDDFAGYLRPHAPADLERVRERAGDEGTLWQSFLAPSAPEPDAAPIAVGMDASVAVFCVHVARMQAVRPGWGASDASAVLTWSDLLAPDLAGAVVMPNPATTEIGFAALAGIVQRFVPDAQTDGRPADAWEFLADLDSAVAVYTWTDDAPCELVARGDFTVGVTRDAAPALPREGEDWREDGVLRIFPAPDPRRADRRMLGYAVSATALVEHGAATRTAAQVFLDWALSPDAVGLYAESTPLVAYELPGAPRPQGYPVDLASSMADTRLDFAALASTRADLQTRWSATFCPPDDRGLPPARCVHELD